MKVKSLLVQIRPRCFVRWRSLPLFGPLLDDFLRWMHDQRYTDSTCPFGERAKPQNRAILRVNLAGLRLPDPWSSPGNPGGISFRQAF
jgi:hypothetical protein